jgi:hypothetical protein
MHAPGRPYIDSHWDERARAYALAQEVPAAKAGCWRFARRDPGLTPGAKISAALQAGVAALSFTWIIGAARAGVATLSLTWIIGALRAGVAALLFTWVIRALWAGVAALSLTWIIGG